MAKRFKKKLNVYIHPFLEEVLRQYCQENNTNVSEIFRVLMLWFLLHSQHLPTVEKEKLLTVNPVDYLTEKCSRYPVGITNNPDLLIIVQEILAQQQALIS